MKELEKDFQDLVLRIFFRVDDKKEVFDNFLSKNLSVKETLLWVMTHQTFIF